MTNNECLDLFPIIGDNGEIQDSDQWLSGESIILLDKLEQMPVLDTTIKVWNQYTHKRHYTSCTKFYAYNIYCTLWNHDGSWDEIDEIEAKSIEMGWPGVGHGWSSSKGGDAMIAVMNPKNDAQGVKKRLYYVDTNSKVFRMILDKYIPVGLSIIVDSKYRKDVKDGALDGDTFAKDYGHADTVQKNPHGPGYMMIDSVGGRTYTITDEQFEHLLEKGNFRDYGYCFLPLNIMNMPELSKKLPDHVQAHEVTDADDKDIIVARETEISEWIEKGGDEKKLYKNYRGKHAITRMLMDLDFIRR